MGDNRHPILGVDCNAAGQPQRWRLSTQGSSSSCGRDVACSATAQNAAPQQGTDCSHDRRRCLCSHSSLCATVCRRPNGCCCCDGHLEGAAVRTACFDCGSCRLLAPHPTNSCHPVGINTCSCRFRYWCCTYKCRAIWSHSLQWCLEASGNVLRRRYSLKSACFPTSGTLTSCSPCYPAVPTSSLGVQLSHRFDRLQTDTRTKQTSID